MGFWDDFGKAGKKVGSGIKKAADVATDTIIDKDAWINTAQAIADGKGGKTIKGSDLLNMALDSTMLIPGAGLAGGAARVGVRTAGRMAEREGAQLVAKKLAQSELRSPLNNMIRSSIRSEADDIGRVIGKKLVPSAGKRAGKHLSTDVAEQTGKRTIEGAGKRAARSETDTQLKRMALKQKKGVGTKIGFGQTKKRIGLNALLAGGANLGVRGYDELTAPKPKGPASQKATAGTLLSPVADALNGGAGSGTLYISDASGNQQALPAGFMETLAEFMKQNGTVDGKQVIYNK